MVDKDDSQNGPKTVPLRMPEPTVPRKETVRISLKPDKVAPTAAFAPPTPQQVPKELRPEDVAAPIKTAPLTAAPKPPSPLNTNAAGMATAPAPLKTTVLSAPKPPAPLKTTALAGAPNPLATKSLATAPILPTASIKPTAVPTVQLQAPRPATSPSGIATQPLKTTSAPTVPGALPLPTSSAGSPVPQQNIAVEEYVDEEAGNKNAGLPLAIGAFAISLVCLVAVCMNVSSWDGWSTLF